MTDRLINEITARSAKEKGFDNGCSFLHGEYDGYIGIHHVDNFNRMNDDKQFSAPTQSLLQAWLRERGIVIGIHLQLYADDAKSIRFEKEKYYSWIVNLNDNAAYSSFNDCDSYEDALEIGLQEALKII